MESLKGKSALITGAGKGVGREVALALAKEGVNLGLLATAFSQLEDIEAELKSYGARVSIVTADVTDIHAVILAVEKLEEEVGTIDILINSEDNTAFGPFLEFDPVTWENNVKTNLLGFYYLTQAVMPSMLEKATGDIFSISLKSERKNKGIEGAASYQAKLPEALMEEVQRNNIRFRSFTAEDMVKEFTLNITEGHVEKSQAHLADFAGYIISQLKKFGGINLNDPMMVSSNPS
jgi:3-oxoacyl-[acyl-carrier protein] reductase